MTASSPAALDVAAKRTRALRIAFSLLVALVSWACLASYVRAPVVASGANLWSHANEDVFAVDAGEAGEGTLAARMSLSWPRDPSKSRALIETELRQGNPEWSLLYRLFRVLAFSNRALEDWGYPPYALEPIDRVIDDTLRLEREKGQAYFLLNGAPDRAYVVSPQRSAFVDGEIALMIAARQLARREHLVASGNFRGYTPDATHLPPREDLSQELRTRLETLRTRMEQSPVLCAESYPDECWTFCTVVILSAMRIQDELDGTQQYADLIKRWGQVARQHLTDPETGLLISSFTQAGVLGDGPEGSSIWFVAHALRWLDPGLAQAQYQAAKRALGVSLFGLGFAREWPSGHAKNFDIDVGSWVPGLEAGAASSGFALLAARAFDDDRYERDLLTSISLFGRPTPGEDFHFAAAGPMGNVVLLYALNQGPLWSRLVEKTR